MNGIIISDPVAQVLWFCMYFEFGVLGLVLAFVVVRIRVLKKWEAEEKKGVDLRD